MASGRKPVHLEQQGGKGNRQRIWEAIRAQKAKFTAEELSWITGIDTEATRSYLQGLLKAEVVAYCSSSDQKKCFIARKLYLVKDNGSEAPSIRRDGATHRMGMGTEAMWRTLRILGETTAEELATMASAAVPTTTQTAKSYLKWLVKAGYVQQFRPHRRAARYRMIAAKYTGPRPPMIQRTKKVYDPNLGQVVWEESPEDQL